MLWGLDAEMSLSSDTSYYYKGMNVVSERNKLQYKSLIGCTVASAAMHCREQYEGKGWFILDPIT